MNKRILAALLVVAFALTSLVAMSAFAGDVADTFVIDSPATMFKNGKKTKTLVTLTHKKHADGYKCVDCHHEYVEGKVEAKKCSAEGCHTAAKDGKKSDLKSAMHNNCYKDCHKKDAKAKSAKAPTKCAECHPKKK